jgi:GNAT superfamily N-acetyltransferase
MVPVRVTALTEPAAEQLVAVAEVFDQYRRHYGQPVVAGQTLAWLSDHTSNRRLSVFVAHVGEDLAGLATTVALPASLRLGCSWQLRDLYVVPGARRRGVARGIVGVVRQAATAAGAVRLSVQTEPSNTAALQLYRTSGFVPVEDIQILALPLEHQHVARD